jgi:peptidoglycan-N-acetylglucosamine deacetylase
VIRAAAAALAPVALYCAPAVTIVAPPLRPLLGVRDRLDAPDAVALTFDDGPHPTGTPAVLELLARVRAPATFFLVGEQVARRPMVAAEIAAAGHEIGLHGHRHRSLLCLGPRALRDDLCRAEEAIVDAVGQPPRLYRPPYGVLSLAGLFAAHDHGWETVLWRRDGRDWEHRATPASIAERLTGRLEARDVLLLHDADFYSAPGSWRRTAAALPCVLDAVAARGLRFGPL